MPCSRKGVEAKEGTKLEQKARRGETQQQARKRSKEGGKREARERWRRRAVEAKEQHWLVCYQQQVPVKQTFNVSSKPSLSPSRADLPPFFLSFSFPFSPLFSSLPSPRTRFLVIDSSIGARPISPHQPIRELISSRTLRESIERRSREIEFRFRKLEELCVKWKIGLVKTVTPRLSLTIIS